MEPAKLIIREFPSRLGPILIDFDSCCDIYNKEREKDGAEKILNNNIYSISVVSSFITIILYI